MKKPLSIFGGIFLVSAFLVGSSIHITSPAGGENWCQNTDHAITWTCEGTMARTVKIVLIAAAGLEVIVDSTENDGSFSWHIPTRLAVGSYRVRVKTTDNAVMHTSPAFTICPALMVSMPAPTVQMNPASLTQVFTMPVNFTTKSRHKDRHSWNCLATMGLGTGDLSPSEFIVGFFNRCADRGPGCADECVAQIFRAFPNFDAARLRTLIGKTIIQSILKFRYKSTEADPACAICLDRIAFYSTTVGDWRARPDEIRALAAPTSTGIEYRIDITEMTRNWLREEDPAYTGPNHNYHMELIGINENMEFNNQKCLSRFDNGSLEVKYRN